MDLHRAVFYVVVAATVLVCICGQEKCDDNSVSCDCFKDCVGCKVFGTGNKSIMDCINQCDDLATYFPVDPEEFDTDYAADGMTLLCKHTNEDNCVESFRVGDTTDGFRDLYVRTHAECPKYEPVYPKDMEDSTDVNDADEKNESMDPKPEENGPTDTKPENKGPIDPQLEAEEEELTPEKTGAVSGSNRAISDKDSGAGSLSLSHLILCFVGLILSL